MSGTDDFSVLTQPDHWLGWLGDDPAKSVRDALEQILRSQVATAKLRWVRLKGEPRLLTGGARAEDNPGKIVVARAALAVSFELEVDDGEDNVEHLAGTFSWVAGHLDVADGRRDQTFFDLGVDIDEAAEQLEDRIYAIDSAS